MIDAPLALAAAAGMLAALNPCGFALLPAYLSLLLTQKGPQTRRAATLRGLSFAAAMTVGFAATFAAFGVVLGPLGGVVQRRLPWFTVVLGIVLVLLGLRLLAGYAVSLPRLRPRRGPTVDGSLLATVGLGAAFAAASLGCTIGPFLAIVVASFRSGSLVEGTWLFLAYSGGMGVVVAVAAVAVAGARASLLGALRRAAPLVSRAGGAVMVVSGAYVAYYGWYELRVLRGDLSQDPLVETAGRLQQQLANGLDRLGLGPLVVVLAILAAAGLARRRQSLRSGQRRQHDS